MKILVEIILTERECRVNSDGERQYHFTNDGVDAVSVSTTVRRYVDSYFQAIEFIQENEFKEATIKITS